MEGYILDPLYRRQKVVDQFESFIWTDRMSAFGDFELSVFSNMANRQLFVPGIKMVTNDSLSVMKVETVQDRLTEEGKAILLVKGRSMHMVLEGRVARQSMSNLTATPKWTITDQPGDIARKLFHDICKLGVLSPHDIIPDIIEGSIFPDDTIEEYPDLVTLEIEPADLYTAIKNVCDLYDMGFRISRHPVTGLLYFDVYAGIDRTTGQSQYPPVVFATELDNLQNTESLTTIASEKNVALVLSKLGSTYVYPLDGDPDINGLDRKVLVVKVDDDETDPVKMEAIMVQRGKEELLKHRPYSAFDGEIQQNSPYKYGIHYNVGDIVEMRNADGATNKMRVVENILVSDVEGDRSYPTLALNRFITPGSWMSWDANKVWADMGPTEYWADLP